MEINGGGDDQKSELQLLLPLAGDLIPPKPPPSTPPPPPVSEMPRLDLNLGIGGGGRREGRSFIPPSPPPWWRPNNPTTIKCLPPATSTATTIAGDEEGAQEEEGEEEEAKKCLGRRLQVLRQQASEQSRLAAMERSYMEKVKELTRREMELAEGDFRRARAVWEHARGEADKAHRLKEILDGGGGGGGDPCAGELTCRACQHRFLT